MTDVKRLVFSIIEFLGDQLNSGNLLPDAAESLEVAIQCLENAYDTRQGNHLAVSRKLVDIFKEGTANEPELPEIKLELTAEEKAEAESLKVEGNNFMKAEKFTEALDCYSKAIKIDDKNAIYYCNRAAAHSKLDKHADAIEDCTNAIAIDPNYSKAYCRMGLAHGCLNHNTDAKECFEKALQLDPDNESYLTNLKITEEKLKFTNLGSQGASSDSSGSNAAAGTPGFGLDLSTLLSNPALMNMATQMMTDPSMQQMIGSFMSGTAAAPGANGFDALLQAGQQLAQQMQASNPQLVDQLRRQMTGQDPNNPDGPPNP